MTPPDPTESSVALDELLAHREWVRVLAFALTGDEHDAADVEQATWLAAMRHPPAHRESLRGWLGTAVRRAAGKLRRSRSRRRAAEIAMSPAAAGRVADDVADLAERADLHRRVVQALVELEAPYRATLLLRFFEGLPIAEVAARTDVPLETARARLRRGIAKLRERMESECGGRDAWFGAAALLVGTKRPAAGAGVAAAAAGGVAVVTAKSWALVAVVAVLGGATLWAVTRPTERVVAVVRSSTTVVAPQVPKPAERPQPPRAERPVAPEAPAPAGRPAEPAPPLATPEGAQAKLDRTTLSVKWQGSSVVEWLGEVSERTGVPILVERSWMEEQRLQRGGGALEMENVPASQLILLIGSMSALAPEVQAARIVFRRAGKAVPAEADLVAIPTIPRGPDGKPLRLVLAVVDGRGVGVAGASVFAEGEADPRGTTDAAGEIAIERRVVLPRFFARSAGAVDSPFTSVPADAAPAARTELRLGGVSAHLKCTVRSRNGRPVEGARGILVLTTPPKGGESAAPHTYTAGPDGAFDDPSAPPGPATVRLSAKGFAKSSAAVALEAGRTTTIEIVLAPECICQGTIRDPKGEPVRGCRVTATTPDRATSMGAAASSATGAFAVTGLPAGKVLLTIVGRDGRPVAETTLDLSEGETATWDPIVDVSAK